MKRAEDLKNAIAGSAPTKPTGPSGGGAGTMSKANAADSKVKRKHSVSTWQSQQTGHG